jgi:hypothetical protein
MFSSSVTLDMQRSSTSPSKIIVRKPIPKHGYSVLTQDTSPRIRFQFLFDFIFDFDFVFDFIFDYVVDVVIVFDLR